MVVTSSHEHVMNLVDWMALTMVSWTCMYMNLARTQPTISYQCMLGLFGIAKFLKSSYKLSYFSIGWPWDKTCKTNSFAQFFDSTHLQFFLLVPKLDLKSLWTYNYIFSHGHNHVYVFPTFFHPQLWHILRYNSMALLFC